MQNSLPFEIFDLLGILNFQIFSDTVLASTQQKHKIPGTLNGMMDHCNSTTC